MVSTAVLSELMVTEVVTATPEDLLSHIIERMRERRISSIVICDDRKPVGIITERDLLTAVKTHRSLSSLKAKDLMRGPVFTLPSSQDCRTAYMKMEQLGYRHLVVVDQQGNLAGIVDEGDFLKNLTADQLLAVKEIRQVMSTEVVTVPLGTALDDAFSIMADRSLSCA